MALSTALGFQVVLNRCLSDWIVCQERRGYILANPVNHMISTEPSKSPMYQERIFHDIFIKAFNQTPLTQTFKIYNEEAKRKLTPSLPSLSLFFFSPSFRPINTTVCLHDTLRLFTEGCPIKLTILYNAVSVKNLSQLERKWLTHCFWNNVILSYPSSFNTTPSRAILGGVQALFRSHLVFLLSLSC